MVGVNGMEELSSRLSDFQGWCLQQQSKRAKVDTKTEYVAMTGSKYFGTGLSFKH